MDGRDMANKGMYAVWNNPKNTLMVLLLLVLLSLSSALYKWRQCRNDKAD